MAKVQWHSIQQYYELVRSGRLRDMRARIMRYMLNYGENGKTRHEIVDRYFCVVRNGVFVALDNGPPIPWQSIASPILWLLGNPKYQKIPKPFAYIAESHYTIADPVVSKPDKPVKAKLLFPAHIDPNKLIHPPESYQPTMF